MLLPISDQVETSLRCLSEYRNAREVCRTLDMAEDRKRPVFEPITVLRKAASQRRAELIKPIAGRVLLLQTASRLSLLRSETLAVE